MNFWAIRIVLVVIISILGVGIDTPSRIVSLHGANLALAQIAFNSSDKDPDLLKSEINQFLLDMKYTDYPALMRQRLEADKLLPKSEQMISDQKQVLGNSIKAYEVFNVVRWLTSEIGAVIIPQMADDTKAREFAHLVSKLTLLQKNLVASVLPKSIENEPDSDIRQSLAHDFFAGKAEERMRRQVMEVVSEILGVAFGEQKVLAALSGEPSVESEKIRQFKNRVQPAVEKYVEFMYTEGSELSESQYLGEALSLYSVHHSRVHKTSFERVLAEVMDSYGLYLPEFVGAEVRVVDSHKDVRIFKIEDGAFVGERSHGQEAAQITSGVAPKKWRNWMRVMKDKLMGSMVFALLSPDEDKIIEAKLEGKTPSHKERFKAWLTALSAVKDGLSHAGEASHVVHPVSSVVRLVIRDIYPDDDLGKIRFITLRQFWAQGPYFRIAVANFDHQKFYDMAKARGYREDVWTGRVFKKKAGEWEPTDNEPIKIKNKLTEQEWQTFMAIHDGTPAGLQRWWSAYRHYVDTEWEVKFLRGLEFAGGFKVVILPRGSISEYCSLCTDLSSRVATGIPLNTFEHTIRWVPRFAKWVSDHIVSVPGTEMLDPSFEMIGPAFLFSQKEILSSRHWVTYQTKSRLEQDLRKFGASARLGFFNIFTALAPQEIAVDKKIIEDIAASLVWTHAAGELNNPKLIPSVERKKQMVGRLNTLRSQTKDDGSAALKTSSAAELETRNRLRQMLKNLGFEGFSEKAKQNLAERTYFNDKARQHLERLAVSYEIESSSRELAAFIGSKVRLNSKQVREDLVELVGRFWDLRPESPPLTLPADIRQLSHDDPQRGAMILKWAEHEVRVALDNQVLTLMSDSLSVIYTKKQIEKFQNEIQESQPSPEALEYLTNKTQIRKWCENIVERVYFDEMVSGTQWAGRALSAVVLNLAAATGYKNELTKSIFERVQKAGVNLKNIFGKTYELDGGPSQSKKYSVPIETGALVLSLESSKEDAAIAAGSRPHNWFRARRLGIKSGKMVAAVYGADLHDGLSMAEQVALRRRQNSSLLNRGFSRVAVFRQRSDENSGLTMNWIFGNRSETRGTVVIGSEQFFANSINRAIAVYDHGKLKDSGDWRLGWNGGVDDWYKKASKMASDYAVYRMMLRGMYFSLKPQEGGSYSSSTVAQSWERSLGIRIYTGPDRPYFITRMAQWWGRLAQKFNWQRALNSPAIRAALAIDNKTLLSPAGLAAQPFIKTFVSYKPPASSPGDSAKNAISSSPHPINGELREILRKDAFNHGFLDSENYPISEEKLAELIHRARNVKTGILANGGLNPDRWDSDGRNGGGNGGNNEAGGNRGVRGNNRVSGNQADGVHASSCSGLVK